jgi:cell division protein FtsX
MRKKLGVLFTVTFICIFHIICGVYLLCVLVSFYVNLTQARDFWEEGISVEIVMPLSDWL